MDAIIRKYRRWRYRNIALLILSVGIFLWLAETPVVDQSIRSVGELGYIGALLAGMFFVSTFTVVPAGAVLFHIAETLDPIGVAVAAGLGGVVGDYLIFRFVRDNVLRELQPVFSKLGKSHFARLFSTPYFAWLAPVVGAIIIASPFPDEIGITLMGISRLKNWQFLVVSFILNTLGILAIVTIARAI